MFTRLTVRNFKRFVEAEIELGDTVVLVGPNNSGKTTILQALALWDAGRKTWAIKRGARSPREKKGVALNRRDIVQIPLPAAKFLWRGLKVRDVRRAAGGGAKKSANVKNVHIQVSVEGVTDGQPWISAFEFDFANEEVLYCRPSREFLPHPFGRDAPEGVKIAYLPPMSGLASVEPKVEAGRIDVLLGEGQTAQVLRNLCHQIHARSAEGAAGEDREWAMLVDTMRRLFGVTLLPPTHVAQRGEITMTYQDESGSVLDLSCAGRGLQQTLLLLTHLLVNPGAVLLLDEPDAHLETLRQRQTYEALTETASRQGSQIIAASHSEVILEEAASRDMVIALVGRPHRIDDRGTQARKALRDISYEHYYLAERTGWVLYLEGSTDLAILRAFAAKLDHPVATHLEQPFCHYVGNHMQAVAGHFYGLREATANLVGVALFDRPAHAVPPNLGAETLTWRRREIENYFCFPSVLLAYARYDVKRDLFSDAQARKREAIMQELISDRIPPAALRDLDDRWWANTKITDDFLDPLFEDYFKRLGLENLMRKSGYHRLLEFVAPGDLNEEVREKLDAIAAVAKRATPRA
ncbi:MAG: AAA family ATPase [Planctomycetes bacterium]|nr:AAA family ATPase [Planctomycetota bacterium]